jgi:hypothetical protein
VPTNPAKRTAALAAIVVTAIAVALLGLGTTTTRTAAPWAMALAIVAWRYIRPPRPLGPPQHRALDDETPDRPRPVEVEAVAWELVRRALDERDRSRADAELTASRRTDPPSPDAPSPDATACRHVTRAPTAPVHN